MLIARRLLAITVITTLAVLLLVVSSTESLGPAIGTSSGQRSARLRQHHDDSHLQQCHLRELDLCLASVAVFTQNTNAHPITNAEINRQCKILLETETCLKNYTRRCMTDMQSHMVDMLADGPLDTIRELCRGGSKIRTNYLKHGDCVNNQNKGQRVCMRDFQVSLEKAIDIEWQDRLKLGCCAYNKLHACLRDVIEPKCGPEAWDMHNTLFRATLSRLPSITCAKYEHSGKACGALLPPAGSLPKGAKSHSVLSKLFSAYTGQ